MRKLPIPHGRPLLRERPSDSFLDLKRKPLRTFSAHQQQSYHTSTSHSTPLAVDRQTLESIAGPLAASETLPKYNNDWTGQISGESRIVVRPNSIEQISEILRYCNKRRLPVVPQGGNTGLVRGSTPLKNEIVLSLERMNRIHSFDENLGSITAQAGVIVETADKFARDRGFMLPIDLGSRGSCQLGGIVSTNAGGIRFLRYGSIRGNLLGIRAVLADGTVFDELKSIRKDNTGYGLSQLFVGAEGTLGVVTDVCMLTPVTPVGSCVAVLALKDFDSCLKTLAKAKRVIGESLSAFEYFDEPCMEVVGQTLRLQRPFEKDRAPFYVLLEASGSRPDLDAIKITDLCADLLNEKVILDAVIEQDSAKMTTLWKFRDDISTCVKSVGGNLMKHDVSLPAYLLNPATEVVRKALHATYGEEKVKVFEYGHLGDGNLHFNAVSATPKGSLESKTIAKFIEDELYQFVIENNGSISAEHGIGSLKVDKLSLVRSKASMDIMKRTKQMLDPHWILNPNKVLRVPSSL